MKESNEKKLKEERLKKGIRSVILSLLCLSVALNAVLGIISVRLRKENERLSNRVSELSESYEYEPSGVYDLQKIRVFEGHPREDESVIPDTGEKKVYLTFDDGPSANTDRILDILKEYDVKATFFVTGAMKESYTDELKRITEEGHTLGMHSYSHRYSEIYTSKEAFQEDLDRLQEFLYETTGVWPRIYRFPGGSSNTVSRIPVTDFIDCLNEEGIVYYDWNIMSGDAVEGSLSAERITKNCLAGLDSYDECVILMHDSADRDTTVDALPGIIEGILNRGDCLILPITDDTTPVQHLTSDKH
ncbi:MAG: polysaccharide deacetylase [Lachnospiraceae bacterium]|nr:polysaccharide deacetylase [Lachnospiraceae bacterium]